MPQVLGISLGWGSHNRVALLALRVAGALMALWLIWRARRGPRLAKLLAVAGGSLLCSPYVMRYEVVLLAPIAITYLFSRSWRIAPGVVLIVGLILFWWLMVAFIVTAALGRPFEPEFGRSDGRRPTAEPAQA